MRVTSPAASERNLLCDLLLDVGPDAPTLCGGWSTRDLAAHLVVRERRPDAAPGIVTDFLAEHSERVRLQEAQRPFEEIVERVRSGAPWWFPTRLDAIDRLANTIEFFVHHEDVRRASDMWSIRDLEPDLDDTLASLLARMGKLLTRKAPVGVILSPDGHDTTTLHAGDPDVTIGGPVGECVMFLYGRGEHAQVELDGSDDAVDRLRSTSFGI